MKNWFTFFFLCWNFFWITHKHTQNTHTHRLQTNKQKKMHRSNFQNLNIINKNQNKKKIAFFATFYVVLADRWWWWWMRIMLSFFVYFNIFFTLLNFFVCLFVCLLAFHQVKLDGSRFCSFLKALFLIRYRYRSIDKY